ncbi:hypothetical protein K7432_002542 [Basidiobolus ranarum]|uniref:CAP-Gly domain-containing protein n=1 Tax=Basidiobolus ranarum TaxID=34480 RepID=A0ABR2X1C0_9FUNG
MSASPFQTPTTSSVPSSPTTWQIQIGSRVQVQNKSGTVRFIGNTSFAKGKWVGVELDEPSGKNDGIVEGITYFTCEPQHGMFVRTSQLKSLQEVETPSVIGSNHLRRYASGTLSEARKNMTPSSNAHPIRQRGTPGLSTPTRLPAPSWTSGPSSVLRTDTVHQSNTSRFSNRRSADPFKSSSIETPISTVNTPSSSVNRPDRSPVFPATPQLDPNSPVKSLNTPPNQSPLTTPKTISRSSDQMVSAKAYDELRFKLEILEQKRVEERERWKEQEKLRNEAEQFLAIKQKLTLKFNELQAELREHKKSLKEVMAEKESLEFKYNDAYESLEMMTLDKEMAEERSENMSQEIALLKEKIEEMSVDLDVFKREKGYMETNDSEHSAIELIQLQRQNDRLKDALVRIRDVTSEQETELNRKIKSLEKELSSVLDIESQYAKVKEQLEHSESQVEELKQRLDDSVGSEDLVEQLSEKNLALGEKIEEMRQAIEDLEAIKELNDELEETHFETEQQLQTEIDIKDAQLRDYEQRLNATEETVADYENTIHQFRQLVLNLQGSLEQMKQKEESQPETSANLDAHSQTMLSLNMQLQSTAMKAQGKAIDLELRRLEAEQAAEQLKYVQPFLPDSFKDEDESLRCLLLLKRVIFKSDLVNNHIGQNHRLTDNLPATLTDEMIPACLMRKKLDWLSSLACRFVSYANFCSVSEFLKIGPLYHEVIGVERRLNGIIEMLRNESLRESDCLLDLQRSITQFERLIDTHLSNEHTYSTEHLTAFGRAHDFNSEQNLVTLGYMKQYITSTEFQEEFQGFNFDPATLTKEFVRPVTSLLSTMKTSRAVTRKLLRSVDSIPKQSAMLKPEVASEYRRFWDQSNKLTHYTEELWRLVSEYISQKKESKQQAQFQDIQQIISSVAAKIFSTEETPFDQALTTSQEINQNLTELIDLTDDASNQTQMMRKEAPWVERARELKSQIILASDLDRKVKPLNEEILSLIRENKMKNQELQEASVKIELLEKRMGNVRKYTDTIHQLETELVKVKKVEQDYEEAIESLEGELESAEKKYDQLVEKMKQGVSAGKLDTEPSPDQSASSNITEVSESYSLQIESLRSALRFLRTENSHLKARKALDDFQLGHNYKNLLLDRNSSTLRTDKGLKSVALETKSLLKEIQMISASPKIIDLAAPTTGDNDKKWVSLKKKPAYQYQTQQSVIYTLSQRSQQLQHKIRQFTGHRQDIASKAPLPVY